MNFDEDLVNREEVEDLRHNVAFIEMLGRHIEEYRKFIRELIAELNTRQPETTEPLKHPRATPITGAFL